MWHLVHPQAALHTQVYGVDSGYSRLGFFFLLLDTLTLVHIILCCSSFSLGHSKRKQFKIWPGLIALIAIPSFQDHNQSSIQNSSHFCLRNHASGISISSPPCGATTCRPLYCAGNAAMYTGVRRNTSLLIPDICDLFSDHYSSWALRHIFNSLCRDASHLLSTSSETGINNSSILAISICLALRLLTAILMLCLLKALYCLVERKKLSRSVAELCVVHKFTGLIFSLDNFVAIRVSKSPITLVLYGLVNVIVTFYLLTISFKHAISLFRFQSIYMTSPTLKIHSIKAGFPLLILGYILFTRRPHTCRAYPHLPKSSTMKTDV